MSNFKIDDSDEEDEEAIIERRRKERQALMAKLATTHPTSASKFEKVSASADIEDTRENEDDEMNTNDEDNHSRENDTAEQDLEARRKEQQSNHEWKSLKMKSNRPGGAVFDMFAEDDSNMAAAESQEDQTIMASNENPNLTDNWDDAEGYYRVQTGETLDHWNSSRKCQTRKRARTAVRNGSSVLWKLLFESNVAIDANFDGFLICCFICVIAVLDET